MKVLILRKVKEDGTSNNGKFVYPKTGYVEAPDWNGKPECGGGLHGLLWGQGTFDLEPYGSMFQVIEVEDSDVVEFDGKCKFKCGNVLLTVTQLEAITLLKAHPNYPKDNLLNYDILTGGDRSTLTGGYRSTLKGGYGSTLTGGDLSVFIVYWYEEEKSQVSVKKITKATANKSFKFENGTFNLLTRAQKQALA